jgi:hypothetical protein
MRTWNDDWPNWELLNYVASKAYEQFTDAEDGLYDELETQGHQIRSGPRPHGTSRDLHKPDDYQRQYPRLSRLFPPTAWA